MDYLKAKFNDTNDVKEALDFTRDSDFFYKEDLDNSEIIKTEDEIKKPLLG